MLTPRSILTVVCFFAFPLAAEAAQVILMVNMNYSQEELNSVRKVAAARGQEVVVVPPQADIRTANAIFSARDKVIEDLIKLKPEEYPNTAAGREKAREYMYEVQEKGVTAVEDPALREALGENLKAFAEGGKRLYELEKRRGNLASQIQKAADALKAAGHQVDSLVFSAHSDGSSLSSETSYGLDDGELTKLRARNPEIFLNPRHVLLLGCYTTTEIQLDRWRRELTPNASLIAGFMGQAPSRKRVVARTFIEEVMATADALDARNADTLLSKEEMQQAFKALNPVRLTFSSLDYCTHHVEGIPSVKPSCDDQWYVLDGLMTRFEREYLNLDSPSKDPPLESHGTELRSFYESLQKICKVTSATGYGADDQRTMNTRRQALVERTIRLIFWWNIQKNFAKFHANGIRRLERAIGGRIPALDGRTGRREFLAAMPAIRREFSKLPQEQRDAIKKDFDALDALVKLDTRIPLNWHEANSVVQGAP